MSPDRKNTDPSSLAAAAGDQIRAIIEAAEQTAAQIRDAADKEAAGIRREAEQEANGIRSQARGDVQALLHSMRAAVSGLSADLDQLEGRLAPPSASEPREPAEAAPTSPEPAPAPAAPEPEPESAATAPDAGGDDLDIESARLVALNMALDGASRDEVDRYLSENFALSDRAALLDEVYSLAGG